MYEPDMNSMSSDNKVFLKMKKQLCMIAAISIMISGMSSFMVYGETTSTRNDSNISDDNFEILLKSSTTSDNSDRQDGRFIKKLEWASPNGELPGTYANYLNRHRLQPAQFRTPDSMNLEEHTLSILVDDDLYSEIGSNLNQYISDVELEGHSVFLQTVSGGTPEEIKAWIIECNNSGSKGVVLIGDITAAWAEVSGSVFPCDLFYMDLDGNWEDNDHDGDYEVHTAGDGDMGPELYVGRIYATTLTYDSEANMVNDYLAKASYVSYWRANAAMAWIGICGGRLV